MRRRGSVGSFCDGAEAPRVVGGGGRRLGIDAEPGAERAVVSLRDRPGPAGAVDALTGEGAAAGPVARGVVAEGGRGAAGGAAWRVVADGVDFGEALSVFADPLARIFDDPDHSEVEPRELIVGYSTKPRLLVVGFTERSGRVSLIHARRATKAERKRHEEIVKPK